MKKLSGMGDVPLFEKVEHLIIAFLQIANPRPTRSSGRADTQKVEITNPDQRGHSLIPHHEVVRSTA